MEISTSRFGPIELNDDSVLDFPDGLPGFEHTRRYFLVPHKTVGGQASPFRWLQCVDEPALAFPVVNPWTVRPDYAPTINALILNQMRISNFKEQAQFPCNCHDTWPKSDCDYGQLTCSRSHKSD